jgi:hypothetical protein
MVENRPSLDDRNSGMARRRKTCFLAFLIATSRGMPPGRQANIWNRVWTGKISARMPLFVLLFDMAGVHHFKLQNLSLRQRALDTLRVCKSDDSKCN